jgi:hypothetical protein
VVGDEDDVTCLGVGVELAGGNRAGIFGRWEEGRRRVKLKFAHGGLDSLCAVTRAAGRL